MVRFIRNSYRKLCSIRKADCVVCFIRKVIHKVTVWYVLHVR